MAKYNLYKTGSVDDIKCSLKFMEGKATINELNQEIEAEMKFKGRSSVINLLNAAINRKMKKSKK